MTTTATGGVGLGLGCGAGAWARETLIRIESSIVEKIDGEKMPDGDQYRPAYDNLKNWTFQGKKRRPCTASATHALKQVMKLTNHSALLKCPALFCTGLNPLKLYEKN